MLVARKVDLPHDGGLVVMDMQRKAVLLAYYC